MSKIVQVTANKSAEKAYEGKIRAIVATVTDDNRLLEVPKLSICALKFTRTARARIEKAGGECLTFDQLAMRAPTGSGVILLRGPKNSREAFKHFGFGPHTDKVSWDQWRPNSHAVLINAYRNHMSRARAGSSRGLVVADGRVVSRFRVVNLGLEKVLRRERRCCLCGLPAICHHCVGTDTWWESSQIARRGRLQQHRPSDANKNASNPKVYIISLPFHSEQMLDRNCSDGHGDTRYL